MSSFDSATEYLQGLKQHGNIESQGQTLYAVSLALNKKLDMLQRDIRQVPSAKLSHQLLL